MLADHVVLWIAHGDMDTLPDNVLALQAHGLTIRPCDDLRSFKKIIPALLEFPGAAITIADDDVYYAPDWLETLVGAVDAAGTTVVSRYALLAQTADDGSALPYALWPEEMRPNACSGPKGMVFPVGIGGVLYPPGSLHPQVTDREMFTALCPQGDDVWLFWMALRAGSTHRHAGGRFPLTTWPSSQKVALKYHNVADNGNDSQIRAMERHFGSMRRNSMQRLDDAGQALAPSGVLNVSVAALTYRRPAGLRLLLEALREQDHAPDRPYTLTVVIVDNDPTGSARSLVEAFETDSTFRLIYTHEPKQGIPIARNRALNEAPAETDLLVFIDDDERPTKGWLDSMLKTRASTGADIIHGPVEPVFPSTGNRYFIKAGVFADRHHPDGERIDYAASNNVMMDIRRIRAAGLKFDDRLRFTGGEDYLFFNQAVRRGLSIHWSHGAMVFDQVPPSRLTWRWTLRRQLRIGNTFAMAAKIQGNIRSRMKWMAIGWMRMALGVALLPGMAVSPRRGWRGLSHLIRGLGIVIGILGIAYEEYAPAKLDNFTGSA